MNKIVRTHYPVDELPPDLRSAAGSARHVTVTLEPEEESSTGKRRSLDDMLKIRRPPYLSASEVDRHIRSERDGWDD